MFLQTMCCYLLWSVQILGQVSAHCWGGVWEELAGRSSSAGGVSRYGASAWESRSVTTVDPLACVALQKAAVCCPSAKALASLPGKARMPR